VADRVVAVDGGYRRYPGAKAASPSDQADVIRKTAEEVGLECVMHIPKTVWAGQVAKRSFMLQMATNGADLKTDWFMAVDADHIWSGTRSKIRSELAGVSPNIDGFHVKMFTPPNPNRDIEISAAGEWHANHAGTWLSPQRIFRSYPTKVERYHWWYSAQKDGKKLWLWGGDRSAKVARMARMRSNFRVEHRCLFREEKQIVRNRMFCEDRVAIVEKTGQEDWV